LADTANLVDKIGIADTAGAADDTLIEDISRRRGNSRHRKKPGIVDTAA
jgi:hypothetical protein